VADSSSLIQRKVLSRRDRRDVEDEVVAEPSILSGAYASCRARIDTVSRSAAVDVDLDRPWPSASSARMSLTAWTRWRWTSSS
jgi:hypothetical protein